VLSARAETLTNISYEGYNVILQLSSEASPKIFSIGDGKPRIVIDLPNGDMNIDGKTLDKGPQVIEGQGVVKRVRVAARDGGLRTVLDLVSGTKMTDHSVVGDVIIIGLNGQVEKAASNTQKVAQTISGPRYFDYSIPYTQGNNQACSKTCYRNRSRPWRARSWRCG